MLLCTLVGPLFSPPPARCPLCVSFFGVMLAFAIVFFLVSPFGAPCVCPLFFSVLPLSCRPVPPHSPVSPPIQRLSADPACIARLPSLAEPCCHSCVPPACSTLAPLCRPYPFPWSLSHHSVGPSVSVSHLIREAPCPVWGGDVYSQTGLWPCPRTSITLDSTTAMFLTLSARVNSSPR